MRAESSLTKTVVRWLEYLLTGNIVLPLTDCQHSSWQLTARILLHTHLHAPPDWLCALRVCARGYFIVPLMHAYQNLCLSTQSCTCVGGSSKDGGRFIKHSYITHLRNRCSVKYYTRFPLISLRSDAFLSFLMHRSPLHLQTRDGAAPPTQQAVLRAIRWQIKQPCLNESQPRCFTRPPLAKRTNKTSSCFLEFISASHTHQVELLQFWMSVTLKKCCQPGCFKMDRILIEI